MELLVDARVGQVDGEPRLARGLCGGGGGGRGRARSAHVGHYGVGRRLGGRPEERVECGGWRRRHDGVCVCARSLYYPSSLRLQGFLCIPWVETSVFSSTPLLYVRKSKASPLPLSCKRRTGLSIKFRPGRRVRGDDRPM